MQNRSVAVLGLIGAVLSTGCSGGGGNSNPLPSQTAATPTTAPTAAPAATPSPAPASAVLSTQNIDGGSAFVTSSGLPVYVSAADKPGVSNCTGGCLGVWPFVAPPTTSLPAPWSAFKRSDNGAMQLEYNGAPLYTFSQDSAGVSSGNGVNGFSLARPQSSATTAATATPTPASSATPTAVPTAAPTVAPTPTPTSAPTSTPRPTATPYSYSRSR